MTVADLQQFLEHRVERQDTQWWVKVLSANDTQLTTGKQAGVYVPKEVMFAVLPELRREAEANPDEWLEADICSHHYTATVRAVWYNKRVHGQGTRNEARITNWGGKACPLLDPENTHAMAVFAFGGSTGNRTCDVWVCETDDEKDAVETWFGPVEPDRSFFSGAPAIEHRRGSCWLDLDDLPEDWFAEFPSSTEIFLKSISLRPQLRNLDPDRRLVRRRECEWNLYQSVESALWLPDINSGFPSVPAFLETAQTLLQRRRSRAGRSLERHLAQIFAEAGLIEGISFDAQEETENQQKPDFLFPSALCYRDPDFDAGQLRMLAAKTTLRERWTQILQEAQRIDQKHLLTLQKGISQNRFGQFEKAGVTLVVPEPLHHHYPGTVRPRLQTVASFIDEVTTLLS